jgi:hypothetical protein
METAAVIVRSKPGGKAGANGSGEMRERHLASWTLLAALLGCVGCGAVSGRSEDASVIPGSTGGTGGTGGTADGAGTGGTIDAAEPGDDTAGNDGSAGSGGAGGATGDGPPGTGTVPICGNGVIEQGEQCDPPGTCPTACPNHGCTTFTLQGLASACTAICVESGKQTACTSNDGCCPAGCTANEDNDCLAVCNNGVKEGKETCDPLSSCPASCPPQGCQLRKLVNAASCAAECVNDRLQTTCASGDGCCPPGCNSTNDNDCKVVCGNGVVEKGETCDPASSCPTSCPAMGCQLRKLANPGSCQAACENAGMQQMCAGGDGCCPAGCNSTNDSDCPPKCDNGVVEAGETCEPVSECQRRQMTCQSDQNTIRTGKGNPAACTFECAASPRPCGPGDGLCPSGCSVDPDCLPRPTNCTLIQFCHNPNQPNQNQLICTTNLDARCTDAERIAECAREAVTVCGQGHARPIIYRPPIGGRGSE